MGRQTDRQAGRRIDRQMDRQIGRLTERRKRDRRTDGWTGGWPDRQTDEPTNRELDKWVHACAHASMYTQVAWTMDGQAGGQRKWHHSNAEEDEEEDDKSLGLLLFVAVFHDTHKDDAIACADVCLDLVCGHTLKWHQPAPAHERHTCCATCAPRSSGSWQYMASHVLMM